MWFIFVLVVHTVSCVVKTEEDVEETEHSLGTLVPIPDFNTNYQSLLNKPLPGL